MKYVPKKVTRGGSRALLKVKAKSPTLLVVGGIVGFGVTTVLAVKATRNAEPVIDQHKKDRINLGTKASNQHHGRDLSRLYVGTGISLAKVYGPTLVVGAISTAAVLSGHNILQKRHVATMAAYSGLAEQFSGYRARVAKTLGAEAEKEIFSGAHGEWQDDPAHKGEQKRVMVYDRTDGDFLRPWMEEPNVEWTRDPTSNFLMLRGLQTMMNHRLEVYGHVFLQDVRDKLGLPRTPEAVVTGWIKDGDGDGYIDFGILTSNDPNTIAFLNGEVNSIQLEFNVDDTPIWNQI